MVERRSSDFSAAGRCLGQKIRHRGVAFRAFIPKMHRLPAAEEKLYTLVLDAPRKCTAAHDPRLQVDRIIEDSAEDHRDLVFQREESVD